MRQSSSTTQSDPGNGEPLFERVGGVLAWGRRKLEPSPTAALDAQLLLAHATDTTRVWVLIHPEAPLSRNQRTRYRDLIGRRAEGVPVAYLRGWTEWHSLRLDITRDVLVPRPETELLLERAMDLARRHQWRRVADIGTGSGAVAVALARSLSDAAIQAIDISAAALGVARRNAASHQVADRVQFFLGNLAEPLTERPDLIVANLPYLSDEMMDEVSADVQHEPVIALRAGPSGLELIEQLDCQLRVRGWRVPLLLEIDPRLSRSARTLFADDADVSVFRDYAGHDRIVFVHPHTA